MSTNQSKKKRSRDPSKDFIDKLIATELQDETKQSYLADLFDNDELKVLGVIAKNLQELNGKQTQTTEEIENTTQTY